MNPIILDSITLKIDINELLERLHMDKENDDVGEVIRLAETAESVGRPKAIYRELAINSRGQDHIVVEDIKLKGPLLRTNLDSADKIYPYLCTCGSELGDWAKSLDDMVEQYWASVIMEMALHKAIMAFEEHLQENYRLGTTSNMNPGSLKGWPISQQRELFTLLGYPQTGIGVELTDSFLMLPIKSISGIRYASEIEFINCRLCPRERCENRRAEFDPHSHKSQKLDGCVMGD